MLNAREGEMAKRAGLSLIVLLSLIVISSSAYSAVPHTINYQGKLTDSSGAAVNATVTMVFSIYNVPSGGTALWTETHSVTVVNGIYSITLGDSTALNLAFDEQYYLGITVGSDAEMTPRQPLTSVGYSFTADTADTAANFSGSLSGDVTGTQSSTVVSQVGGQTAANVASGVLLANNATSANTSSAIVKRDSSGNFSAGTITAALNGNASSSTNSTNFSGSLSGDVTGTQSATVVSQVGGQTAANVAAGAVLANNATSANTSSAIVKRDSSGDFSAHNITANTYYGNGANLTGIASGGPILVKDSSSTPQTIGKLVYADMYGFSVLTGTGYIVGFNWDNSKSPAQIYWTSSNCTGTAYLNDGWGGSGDPQIMFGKSAVWSAKANSYMVPYTVTNGYSTSVTFTAATIENPTCYASSGTDSGWRLKTVTNAALGVPDSITLPFTLN
jgi:hypothetical protein